MWNDKLEARAAKMRERYEKMAELLRLQDKKVTPKNIEAICGNDYVLQRITEEQRMSGLQKIWTANKAKGDAHRNNILEVVVKDPTVRLRGRGKGNPDMPGAAHYPACPHCPGSTHGSTIRAGFHNGIQRYRCIWCRRTFTGPKVVIRLEPFDYTMICYHCGNTNVKRIGKGMNGSRTGRMGLCLKCNRKFVQGGLHDLQKYHLVLEKRIADLNLPDDVEAEVLQMACEAVLIGKGYCWSIELNTKQAYRNVRGEWGQKGSDHPKFREQMGQKKYDD